MIKTMVYKTMSYMSYNVIISNNVIKLMLHKTMVYYKGVNGIDFV